MRHVHSTMLSEALLKTNRNLLLEFFASRLEQRATVLIYEVSSAFVKSEILYPAAAQIDHFINTHLQ